MGCIAAAVWGGVGCTAPSAQSEQAPKKKRNIERPSSSVQEKLPMDKSKETLAKAPVPIDAEAPAKTETATFALG